MSAAPEILRTLGAVFPPRRGGSSRTDGQDAAGDGRSAWSTRRSASIVTLPDPKVILLGTSVSPPRRRSCPSSTSEARRVERVHPEHVLVRGSRELRVGGYPVSGDLGFFARLGSDPAFAISGRRLPSRIPARRSGARRPPSAFVDLSPPIILNVRATAYVALTTSSLQLGGGSRSRARRSGQHPRPSSSSMRSSSGHRRSASRRSRRRLRDALGGA